MTPKPQENGWLGALRPIPSLAAQKKPSAVRPRTARFITLRRNYSAWARAAFIFWRGPA